MDILVFPPEGLYVGILSASDEVNEGVRYGIVGNIGQGVFCFIGQFDGTNNGESICNLMGDGAVFMALQVDASYNLSLGILFHFCSHVKLVFLLSFQSS